LRRDARRAELVGVCEVVQAFWHWPHIDSMPPALRQQALDSPLWRYEADVYTSGLGHS